ncbi:hypothetical protein I3760_11G024700 [Carya illinoinensis]|nr:hypothetical protein I3760_11G024700 [Carya illinoinensis]
MMRLIHIHVVTLTTKFWHLKKMMTQKTKNYRFKARRPSGNRAAVRKYREKRKAHTAYLEEEVEKLRLLNQQLVRKLQRQAILEAEALRLKSLLLHLVGKIDNELGVFPNQKQGNANAMLKNSDCGLQSGGVAISLRCQLIYHPSIHMLSHHRRLVLVEVGRR